jgi:hypothetical protein
MKALSDSRDEVGTPARPMVFARESELDELRKLSATVDESFIRFDRGIAGHECRT